MDDQTIFAEASQRLGLPFSIDNFYLPIVRPEDAKRLGDAPFIEPTRIFDFGTIRAFADLIAKHFRADLPSHESAVALGLGAGYGFPDCHVYQQVVSAYEPGLIVEIGAGVSTFFARQANKTCRIVCIEPYPAPAFPKWCVDNNVELWREPLQSAAKLDYPAKTILFVDSTHVAKITSELHIPFLDLMPRLPSGALIHFHDIFLPYACLHGGHNLFAQTANWYESMLLGIFLSASRDYETVFPQYYLGYTPTLQDILVKAIPAYAAARPEGSSYWIRKR